MGALITYDLKEQDPDLHEKVRKEMLSNVNISDKYAFPLGSIVYILPNTTFYSSILSDRGLLKVLENTCKQYGATLERCLAVNISGVASGIPGIPF